jgi:BMFP domain-containing protein YqiC
MRREVETAFRSQAERFLNEMDLVRREEFDAVKEMAARARDESESLKKRIAALEAQLAGDQEPVKRGARSHTGEDERTGSGGL